MLISKVKQITGKRLKELYDSNISPRKPQLMRSFWNLAYGVPSPT